MKKRSQITVFIILGILIIFLISFFYYIASSTGHKKMKSQSEELLASLHTSRDLEYFMSSCMFDAAKNGVNMVALTGGFIQEDYPNKLVDFPIGGVNYYSDYLGKNITVAYQILETNFSVEKIGSGHIYPCWESNYTNSLGVIPDFFWGDRCYYNFSHSLASEKFDSLVSNFKFGRTNEDSNKLDLKPALCKANQVDGVGYYSCKCESPLRPNCKFSIQSQLESYIAFKLDECSDLSSFERSLGAKINKGNISVNVTIGNNDVSVNVLFPISISLPDDSSSSSKISVFSFNTVVPINLKTVYTLLQGDGTILSKSTGRGIDVSSVNGFIYRDINNLSFDIVRDGYSVANSYGYGGIRIEREFLGGGDSIIKIIDTSSMVDGKNFTFEFARQNRKPSLDYLRLNAKYGEDYDVYVYENEPFILRPEGYDPDEDDLVYKYSGWKVEPNNNVWESSDIYLNASDVSDAYCSHPFYGLTNSRCANYRPTREDIGPHVLTITSIDSGGKSDYQFVKIFVDDIPNASFVVHSIYDDIPNFTVSKEDPVIFDARESIDRVKPFPTSMMEYRWVNDPSNPAIEKGFPYSRNLRPSYFAVPSIPASGFNFNNLYGNPYILDDSNNAINTYTNYLKDKDSLLVETHAPFGFPGAIDTIKTLLTLNLYIDGKQSGEPYRHEVYNAQCLPHRSEVPAPLYDDFINDFVDVPNTIDGLPDALNPNIFLANHTCCIGNPNGQPNTWAIAPIGTVCYNFTDYGKYHEFISGAKRIEGLSSPSGDSPPPVGNTDTYERKIIGKCTGDRGNVCKLAVNSLKKAPFYSKILGDGSNPFNGIDAVCAEFNCSSNFVYVDSSDVSSGITRYYISPMIDAGFDTVLYEKIKYSLLIPIEVFDSVVCLKIASASDSVDLPVVINPPMGDIQFTGPRGTTEDDDCYSSDDFISSNHDNNRYIKILFRMAISFGTLIDSPSLNSVEISYKEAQ